ncbi:hypothetical protein MACJ_000944 [Theileria orientalis]|uniref:Uncharacterized protein n=1 Tax=Theileria orientalis TaxID=68886 RepID=A0A976QV08_THEOR|nr:hypothetical protein MACJ_000944 [Theileria orientalis]
MLSWLDKKSEPAKHQIHLEWCRVENVSFIVKTFESNYFNSSERKRQTEFNGFHLLDQFENSYFSLVNDKINRLEWRGIERPVHEKNRAGDKDSSEMVTILGDVWIAEFVVPVDFELFKKILTGAIYTMCHNLKPFVVQYTQPFASEDPPDGKNSRKTINSVEEPVAHTNSYSKAGEVDSHYAKAPEDPPSIDKPDDMINPVPIPVREKTGGPGRPKKARSTGWRGRPRSLRPLRPSRLHEEAEPVTNQIEEEKQEEPVEKVNVEQVDQEEYEYEKHEHEEDFDPDEEFDLPKRTRRSPDKPRSPVDGGNGNYLKTEHFAQLLANCPFFSGHKVINAAIASKKAASIIDKLTKDADIPKSQSSEEESEVSDSVHLSTESIQRATESFELMDLNGNLSLIPDAVKRSTKKKYKRTYTSIPRYLKRSKHRSRHAFLQVSLPLMTSPFRNSTL